MREYYKRRALSVRILYGWALGVICGGYPSINWLSLERDLGGETNQAVGENLPAMPFLLLYCYCRCCNG